MQVVSIDELDTQAQGEGLPYSRFSVVVPQELVGLRYNLTQPGSVSSYPQPETPMTHINAG